MSDEPKKGNENSWVLRRIFFALVFLILYPLSVGLLAFLAGAGCIGNAAIEANRPIYAPIVWVCDRSPTVGVVLIRYETESRRLGQLLTRRK
jgi:hypothetical protein